jgi:hypothetical protein
MRASFVREYLSLTWCKFNLKKGIKELRIENKKPRKPNFTNGFCLRVSRTNARQRIGLSLIFCFFCIKAKDKKLRIKNNKLRITKPRKPNSTNGFCLRVSRTKRGSESGCPKRIKN